MIKDPPQTPTMISLGKMTHLIKSAIFDKKGDPPSDVVNSLVVTGGTNTVSKTLQERFKWDGSTPTACPVFGMRDGKIVSSRWTILGKLAKTVKFKAEDLFSGARKDLFISLDVDDLSIFEFDNKSSNWSYWVESKDLQYVVRDKVAKKDLDQQEAEDEGVEEFCARLMVLTETPNTVLLYLAVVPLSLDNLKERLPADYSKNNCPQVPLALSHGSCRPIRIRLAVEERGSDGWGYGCLPLLEHLSGQIVIHPDPAELRQAVHGFMRKVQHMNNRGGKKVLTAMGDPVEVAKVGQVPHLWPEAPAASREVDDEGRKFTDLVGNPVIE